MRRTLRERLARGDVLKRAFVEVTYNANPDSAGPDRITISQFKQKYKSELAYLRSEIRDNKYVPSPGRGVAISKKKAPTRRQKLFGQSRFLTFATVLSSERYVT